MAKARVLANVGVKGKPGELVYYKDGKLYAVKAKRGGTKGRRTCTKPAPKKKAATKKKTAVKKKTAKRR